MGQRTYQGDHTSLLSVCQKTIIAILVPRPLKKSSNQNGIKIKVLYIDDICLQCGPRFEIKPHKLPPEPKSCFLPFPPYSQLMNIMHCVFLFCRYTCMYRDIFVIEYHSYICHLTHKKIKLQKDCLFGLL